MKNARSDGMQSIDSGCKVACSTIIVNALEHSLPTSLGILLIFQADIILHITVANDKYFRQRWHEKKKLAYNNRVLSCVSLVPVVCQSCACRVPSCSAL